MSCLFSVRDVAVATGITVDGNCCLQLAIMSFFFLEACEFPSPASRGLLPAEQQLVQTVP